MITGSKLFRRFFFVVLMVIAVMFTVVYLYSVPLIRKNVYEIERNSAHLALNNAFQLANKMYANLESYRDEALNAHKQRLKAIIELTEANIRQTNIEAGTNKTQQTIFRALNQFTYGNDGYIWIANNEGILISHPNPRFQNKDIRELSNSDEKGIIEHIISSARKEGEGYYQYKWQRLEGGPAVDKLSYVKYFPEWGLIIGSGLYLDDIEQEVQQRRQKAIIEVRKALQEIRVAKTGYLFIFNTDGMLLAHPNPNIDQTNALELLNPVTGQPIVKELIAVADTGRELNYKWDKPTDPGNYIYDKISLVRKLDGFGWYICSTVYVDELKHSSVMLSDRILTIALLSIFLAVGLALIFIRRITRPIKQLSDTAKRVREGDLTVQSGIRRDDEIGLLASTFDQMINQVHSNIRILDSAVKSRTHELGVLEERQRLILDSLPAQIAYLNADCEYLFVNQGYAEFIGKNKDEIVNQPLSSVLTNEMQQQIHSQVNRCLNGEEVVFEYQSKEADKPSITKRILIPDIDQQGNVNGLLNLSLDITAEKEAERKLTEAQRMNATGQLAGGLAHDFNNLLSVILGNLLAASDKFDQETGLSKYLTPAIKASRKGADITARLLSFSRRQALSPSRVNLSKLLAETTELLEGSLPDSIEIVSTVCGRVAVFVDAAQLENALINLALNARDAMPEGGRINFAINSHKVNSETPANGFDEPVPNGEYIQIKVSDSGTGFSDTALIQAYEPFFTTKSNGHGSGLGLSMVYGFIKQSEGFIAIKSTPQGAEINMLLPVLNGKGNDSDNPVQDSKWLATKKKEGLILLVEDDQDVREVIRDQLLDIGYTVIDAIDADEAKGLITTLDYIDYLVTDIKMPGCLNGFQLADLMREKHPDCGIVLMSGYAYDQLPASHNSNRKILKKPFLKEELLQALADQQKS